MNNREIAGVISDGLYNYFCNAGSEDSESIVEEATGDDDGKLEILATIEGREVLITIEDISRRQS